MNPPTATRPAPASQPATDDAYLKRAVEEQRLLQEVRVQCAAAVKAQQDKRDAACVLAHVEGGHPYRKIAAMLGLHQRNVGRMVSDSEREPLSRFRRWKDPETASQ